MIDLLLGETPSLLKELYFQSSERKSFIITHKRETSSTPLKLLTVESILNQNGIFCFNEIASPYIISDRNGLWTSMNGSLLFHDEVSIKLKNAKFVSGQDFPKNPLVHEILSRLVIVDPDAFFNPKIEIKIVNKSPKLDLFEASLLSNGDIENCQKLFLSRLDYYFDRLRLFFPGITQEEAKNRHKELGKRINFNVVKFKTFEASRYLYHQLCNSNALYTPDLIMRHANDFDELVFNKLRSLKKTK